MANRIAQATVGIDVDKSDLLKQINEALKSGQALANGAQINIDTNVDTSELKKQLQEAEKEVKRIQNKINSVDLSSLKSGVEKAYKTMDKNPDSDKFLRDFVKSFKEYIALGGKVKDLNEDIVEAYKLSDFDKEFVPIKKIKLLSDELQVAKDKVESLNSAIKSTGTGGFDSTSTQIKELQEQLDDLGKKYKELQEKMSKVKGSDVDLASNEQFTKLASNLAEVQKEIVDIKEEMKQFASNDNWADGAIKELIESYKRVNDEVQTVISSIQELRKLQSTPIAPKPEEKLTSDPVKSGISSDSIKEEKTELQGLIDEFTRLASLHEHMRTNMSGFSKSPTYTQESIQEVQTVYTELKQAMIAMNQLQINPEVNKDKILELSAYITELDKKFKVLATYNDSKQGDTLNYLGIAKEDHGLYFDTNKYVLDWQVLSELMWDVSKKIREIDSTFEASSITINPEPFKEIIGLLNTIENKAEDITPLPSGDKTEVSYVEEPSGQMALFKGVENSVKAEEKLEQQTRETNDVIEGQITLLEHLASLPPTPTNKSNLSTDDDLKKDKGTTGQVIDAEVQEFEKLRGKVKEVETAIEEKTNAITAEKIAMEIAAKSEADSLQNVINKVDELKNGLKELPEVKVPAIKVEEEKIEQGQIASGATHIQNNPKEAVKRGKSKGEKVDTSLTPEQLKARTDSLRKTSEELEANLAEQGSIIKSVTDFYDSQDNLVKTVLKEEKELGDGTKKATTWTTNYNLEKGTSFSSHIDTTSFIDESKAVEAVRKAQFEEAKKYLSDYKTYSINAIHSTVEANKQMYEEEAASAKASANAIINTLKIEGVLLEQEENQYDALSDSIERTIKLKTDERQNVQNQRDFNADWDAAIKENKEFDKRKAQEKAQLEKYEQERTAEEKRLSDIRIQQAEYEANEKRKHEQEYISWWETTYRDVDEHLSDTYSKLESNLTKQNPLKLKDNSNKLSSNEQLELNRLMQEETNLRGIIADYSSIGIKNQQAEIELQKKQNALAEDYSNTLRTQATNAREAAQKELSKAIDDYGYGDTTEAKKYLSQLSSNSIYPDFNNLDSQIKSINDTVDDIVSKLKTSHISNKSGMASDIKEENEKVSKLLSENKKHYEDIWRIRKQIEVIDDTPENAEYLRTLKKQQAFYGKQYEASKKEIENLNIKSVLQKQEETRLKIKEEQLRVINTLIEKGNASEATRNQKVLDRFQNSANQSLANFNIDFKDNPNLSNIEERLNALKASVNSITDQEGLKRFNKELNQLGDSIRGVSDLSASKISNKIQKWLDDNTNASHELRAELERLQQELNDTFVTKTRSNEILQRLNEIDSATRKANKSGDSFFTGWKKRMKNLALYLTSFASFYDVINKLREGVSTITEIDTAMTELRKVSSATEIAITNSFDAMVDSAKEYGSTVTDMINATADWSRMGYGLPDAQELAKVSVLYKNVGDGIDIDTANSSLISTLQGFQLDVSEAESIIDKFNEVANNYAIDSAGIGEALQRSAASFNAANTDLSKSIALITATMKMVEYIEIYTKNTFNCWELLRALHHNN